MGRRLLTRERILEIMKCYRHLPEPENLEVTILRGHLLVEDRLKEYIRKRLPNPSGCDLAGFRVSQLIAVARGLCPSAAQETLWQSVHKLNVLRNRLSHELDDARFTAALEDFLTFQSEHFMGGDPECRNIHSCVVSVYSSLVHLIAEGSGQQNPQG